MSIVLSKTDRSVTAGEKKSHLTPREYDILEYLMDHPNETLAPEEIYGSVWDEEPFQCRPIISVHIRHIREKIEVNPSKPVYVNSFWGRGYRFNAGE